MTIGQALPDILQNRRSQASQADLRRELQTVQQEVATGVRADRRAATGGDTAMIMSLDRAIADIEARAPSLGRAQARASATQTALQAIQAGAAEIGAAMLDAATARSPVAARARAGEAETALAQMMAGMNAQLGDRYLLSGAATDTPAVGAAEDLLAEVGSLFTAAIGAGETVEQALARVDAYFDPASGAPLTVADTILGPDVAAAEAPPVSISDTESVAFAARADDPGLLALMKGYALGALSLTTGYGAADEVDAIRAAAGAAILAGDGGLIDARTRVGAAESRIEATVAAQQAERTTLSTARNDIMGVDQYEAATRLSQIETQLEALYLITARAAQLSFVNYMR